MRAAHRFALFLTLAAGAAAAIAQARAGGGDDQGEDPGPLFRADLSGYHEGDGELGLDLFVDGWPAAR